ncbi:hypothetical protein [Paraliomyxa miuraensis]|uniref:hypothetical protein n=1 Tax=Paraliomyxa miuraensis TaxID=376150 RepID=UPI002255CBFD|nr:hypothetical protein [Paraliomyxa miuraensis]MCX4239786.1 hypothetical protein [Paraliomyxa miuraensis]
MAAPSPPPPAGLQLRRVITTWWPLALSWGMMGLEQPLVSAAVARLPDPAVQLAAWGSFAFPLALVVEAPIIMLLAASTELSRDQASYRSLRRVAHGLGLGLTLLHLLVVVTPVFDWLAATVLELPAAVREPAREGLLLLLPWTWSIASRRFHQGALIRHGRSRAVGWGTGLRLLVASSVLGLGLLLGGRGGGDPWLLGVTGVRVAAVALSCGVLAEAVFAAIAVRSVHRALPPPDPERPPLRGAAFWRFYVPLAMTPLVTLVILPVGTAAVARMPDPLASLAVWPVANALVWVLQALGIALNEVVVALLDEPGAGPPLRRFTFVLAAGVTGLLGVLSLPPVADAWFSGVAGLLPPLAAMGTATLWLALPIPAMRVIQSWYQGLLVNARRTRGITEAVVVFGGTCSGVLLLGVYAARWDGLPVMLVAYSLGRILQTAWLWWRASRIQ